MSVAWDRTRIPVWAVVATVAAATAAASLLRRQPLSWDEAVSVAVATRPVHAVAGTLQHSDAVLGLYYLLLHGWGSLGVTIGLRPTEWWWRLPSAGAAVGTCVIVALCARRLAGPAAGLLAGVTLAVLPLFAFYTVDARPYTLAAFTVTTAWWVWTGPTAGRSPRRSSTLVVALVVIAAWLQLFTVLVWPAFLLVRGRPGLRRSLLVLGAATAGVFPLLRVALGQSSEIGWIPTATVANTLGVALHVGGGLAIVLLSAAVAALGVRAGVLRRTPMTFAVLWWTCAPLAILAALDVVRPVLVARYALVSLPLVAVGFGVVVARAIRVRVAVRIVAVATVVAAVVTSAWQGSRPFKYEDYRAAAAFAAHEVSPGTPALFAPSSSRLGFDLYSGPARLHDLALPAGVGSDPLAIPELAPPLLREQVSGACAVVLVGDPLTKDAAARSAADRTKVGMVAGWTVVTARAFGQVAVTVLANPACGARTSSRS